MDQLNGRSDSSDSLIAELRLAAANSTVKMLHVLPRTKLFLEVLIVLMCLGAVTGNILVILIVAATKTFHSVTSVLIINLAISDLLVGIGVMPFVAVSVMNDAWVSCEDLCLYVGYTSSVYCTASVLTLAAIALDRYRSIIDCLRYSSQCTLCRKGAAVLWIWLQAMVTSCPPLLGWSEMDYVGPMYICTFKWSSSPSYTVFMSVLCFLLPAAVILFCYVRIVKVARGHARRIHDLEDHLQRSRGLPAGSGAPGPTPAHLQPHPFWDMPTSSRLVYYLSGRIVPEAHLDRSHPGAVLPDQSCSVTGTLNTGGGRLRSLLTQLQASGPQHNHHQQGSQQHHGVVRLLVVIAAFFLCWTPFVGVMLVQAVETALSRPSSVIPPDVVTFAYWLLLLNSDINPLLYALLSKRFQGALKSLRRKLRSWLRTAIGRGGDGADEGEHGNHEPCTVTATNHLPQFSSNNAPSERTNRSSVFSVDSNCTEVCKEPLSGIFLPGSSSSSSSSSVWQNGGRERHVDRLQVPSKPQEGDRLPFSAATKDRQATFFFGQITVKVEHAAD
ncbi:octopamine receptor 1 [Anguilla anguilla]|uniref:octopamine receptor 1 n=1 Tax=Anguilla anguilla TaxID=7936 RepID=UPI0015A9F1D9|nr:octopamine receptor 1 [Anguilla anguilla]